jgi:KamA family protein
MAVAKVMPFRVNEYVLEELVHWTDVPEDPLYQMTFPQPEMLEPADFQRLFRLLREGASEEKIRRAARRIQQRMNPHPAGQIELNVPVLNGRPLPGIQHKYRETVLVFPRQGQTCHAYCTYCFRWAQFLGIDELKFATREADRLARYLQRSDEASDVLITGGDPLVMKTSVLRRYIEPLLAPELSHLTSIRIGTKALSFWPFRFLTDSDADDLLRLFEQVRRAGKQLALMAHFSHPRELEPPLAQKALERVQSAGAVVRCQSPLIRHVNDDPRLWAELWRQEVRLGAIPYYMFVARDTGARHYFEVPLAEAYEIYRRASNRVSGLARTVRGPSMSATPGKVLIQGVAEIAGEKLFVLSFIQARDPSWVGRPFFARFDPRATWLDQLQPANGAKDFFFDPLLRKFKRSKRLPAWSQERQIREGRVLFGHVEWE